MAEVLSPHDETFGTFGFYAAHGVEELWVADPLTRSVSIWQRDPIATDHRETGTSDLLDLTATAVADQLDRPEG